MQLILRDVRLLQYTMKRSCRLATCRACRSRTHNSPQHSWRPSVWLLSQLRACSFLGFVREQSSPIFPRYLKNNQIDTRFVCKNKYFLPSARSIHHAGMLLPAQTLRMLLHKTSCGKNLVSIWLYFKYRKNKTQKSRVHGSFHTRQKRETGAYANKLSNKPEHIRQIPSYKQ